MPPRDQLCLRDRQVLQTRESLQRSALTLVAERGYAAVSVQDISASAGVSPRTFFNHFRTKDEAVVPDVPAFTADQRRTFLEPGGDDLFTALERLVCGHLLAPLPGTGTSIGELAASRRSSGEPELLPRTLAVFEVFADEVAALVAERSGRPRGDLESAVAARSALAAVHVALRAWRRGPADADLPGHMTAAFAALRGLVAQTS